MSAFYRSTVERCLCLRRVKINNKKSATINYDRLIERRITGPPFHERRKMSGLIGPAMNYRT